MKDLVIRAYGEEFWAQYRYALNARLPGSNRLPASDLWSRSLISVRCEQFN
jgi:hypothetical protein